MCYVDAQESTAVRERRRPASQGEAGQERNRVVGFGSESLAALGVLPATGGTRFYQAWFRNQAPQFCTPALHGMSNGIEITWGP